MSDRQPQSFLTWLSVITNTSLVYLFRPQQLETPIFSTEIDTHHPHTSIPIAAPRIASLSTEKTYKDLIIPAFLLSLAASHLYFLARVFVRHVVDRLVWKDSEEARRSSDAEREVKRMYLKSMGLDQVVDEGKMKEVRERVDGGVRNAGVGGVDMTEFWKRDEGVEEILKSIKEA